MYHVQLVLISRIRNQSRKRKFVSTSWRNFTYKYMMITCLRPTSAVDYQKPACIHEQSIKSVEINDLDYIVLMVENYFCNHSKGVFSSRGRLERGNEVASLHLHNYNAHCFVKIRMRQYQNAAHYDGA
jgi:hypothetical protein